MPRVLVAGCLACPWGAGALEGCQLHYMRDGFILRPVSSENSVMAISSLRQVVAGWTVLKPASVVPSGRAGAAVGVSAMAAAAEEPPSGARVTRAPAATSVPADILPDLAALCASVFCDGTQAAP